jgi:hypothetical protein
MVENEEIECTLLNLIHWNIVCLQNGAFKFMDLEGECWYIV